METFFLKHANEHFFVNGRSTLRVNDMVVKMAQKKSPVLCDGYVKNEETKVDRLVAILKTNNWGGDAGGDGPCNTAYSEFSKQPASGC